MHSQYKADDGKLHEQERDIAKVWKSNEIRLALYGIENQTNIDEQMPLRIFGYEGASYRGQYGKDRIIPSVTMILYFGNEHWDNNRNLSDLFDIPNGLDKYINDIHINVFEIAWLNDEQLAKFKSDFGVVARFFVEKRKNKSYISRDKTELKHIDEVLKLLSVITKDNRYEKWLSNSDTEKGVKSMCEVLDNAINLGIEKGIEQGRLIAIIELVNSGDLSIERAAAKLNMTVTQLDAAIKSNNTILV